MKWYTRMVHMARAPRVLAREYRVSWVIMVDFDVLVVAIAKVD